MAQRTFLLDLDGTLWDSRQWYAEALAQLSGSSATVIASRLKAGENLVKIAKEHGASKTRLVQIAKENGGSLQLYGGVLRALGQIQKRKDLIGVVTNLPGWLVLPLLEATGIEKYLDAVVTPQRGVPAKPSPRGIWKALECLDCKADPDTWYVGDSTADAKAAKAARISFAWASYGYEDKPPEASQILKSFDEVLQL